MIKHDWEEFQYVKDAVYSIQSTQRMRLVRVRHVEWFIQRHKEIEALRGSCYRACLRAKLEGME